MYCLVCGVFGLVLGGMGKFSLLVGKVFGMVWKVMVGMLYVRLRKELIVFLREWLVN